MTDVDFLSPESEEIILTAHIEVLARATAGTGVVSGNRLVATSPASMDIDVGSGQIKLLGVLDNVDADVATIGASSPTLDRIDLIIRNADGDAEVVAGALAALNDPKGLGNWHQYDSPAPPEIIPNGVILGAVYVSAGVTSISDAAIWMFAGRVVVSDLPIVTEIASPGSDDNVPSEQAVREEIDALMPISYLTTTIADPGVDTKVPSEKAVRSGLTARIATSAIATTIESPGVDTKVPSEQAVRELVTGPDAHVIQADGKYFATDKVRARDGDGLYLVDDGGLGIFVKDGGKIGIGTLNPACALDVAAASYPISRFTRRGVVSSTLQSAIDLLAKTSVDMVNGFGAGITFSIQDDEAGPNYIAGIYGLRSGDDSFGDLVFVTRHSDIWPVSRMRITREGLVGIGTATPVARLAVNGGMNVGGDADPGDNNLYVVGNCSVGSLTVRSGALHRIWDAPAGSWQIPTSNYPELTWDVGSNGNTRVYKFDDTVEEFIEADLKLPDDLNPSGTVTIEVTGYALVTAASKYVQWKIYHSAKAVGESWDAAYATKSSGDKACNSTQDQLDVHQFTETVSNLGWAANDNVRLKLSRIAPTGTNLTGDYCVVHVRIKIPTVIS